MHFTLLSGFYFEISLGYEKAISEVGFRVCSQLNTNSIVYYLPGVFGFVQPQSGYVLCRSISVNETSVGFSGRIGLEADQGRPKRFW